jgi:hypothetical protein
MRVKEFKDPIYTVDSYRVPIIQTLQMLQKLSELERKQGLKVDVALEVRLFNSLPGAIDVVQYDDHPQDDVIYQGNFLPFSSGSDSLPATELKRPDSSRDSRLFGALYSYVDEKWQQSGPSLDLTSLRNCAQGDDVSLWLSCIRGHRTTRQADTQATGTTGAGPGR